MLLIRGEVTPTKPGWSFKLDSHTPRARGSNPAQQSSFTDLVMGEKIKIKGFLLNIFNTFHGSRKQALRI